MDIIAQTLDDTLLIYPQSVFDGLEEYSNSFVPKGRSTVEKGVLVGYNLSYLDDGYLLMGYALNGPKKHDVENVENVREFASQRRGLVSIDLIISPPRDVYSEHINKSEIGTVVANGSIYRAKTVRKLRRKDVQEHFKPKVIDDSMGFDGIEGLKARSYREILRIGYEILENAGLRVLPVR